MLIRKALLVCGLCLLTLISAFGQEVTERSRLGAVIEGVTYIGSGSLAGRVAFIDCWGIYVNDLIGGGYEKLCSVEQINFGAWPRGIGYVSEGEFAGNFLISDLTKPSTLFMASSSGDLVSEVRAQGFQFNNSCEGSTEITSGPYEGRMALLGYTPVPGGNIRHIYIFRMERQADGMIFAFLEKDIAEVHVPAPYDIYALSIAFLPDDFPAFPNHFALGDVAGAIRVYDDQGVLKATYSGVPNLEGMTYIRDGVHQGKLFITSYSGSGAAIRTLDGSQSTPVAISVGAGIVGASSSVWLKDRRQLAVFSWNGLAWNWPLSFLSRPSSGQWRKDAELAYRALRAPRKMTDMTKAGTYYLFGYVDPSPGKSQYRIHVLDNDFQLLAAMEIPPEYGSLGFGRMAYVPGTAAADDRFAVTSGKKIFSFDPSFSFPAEIIDLTEKFTNNIGDLCYDPGAMRFYALDLNGRMLRVFDRAWNSLTDFDLSGLIRRGFNDITRFTSGDLKNSIALIGGTDRGDNDVVCVNFEYQIGADLLGKLKQGVIAGGLKAGLANSLDQKLDNALKSLSKKNIIAAVNQIQAFQNEVQAQRGKGIPTELADRWLELCVEIVRGLEIL